MKTRFTFLIVTAVAFSTAAQTVVPQNVRATNTLDGIINNGVGGGEILYGIPLEPGKIIGDAYLDTAWNVGSIHVYKNDIVVAPLSLRYDVQANEINIQVGNEVKVIPGNRVKIFRWTKAGGSPAYFVNAQDYKKKGVPLSGFFKVVSEGKLTLVAHPTVVIKKADYNMQLSTGSRDDKIIKKVKLFILQGTDVVEAPSSRKKLLTFFGDKAEQVSDYIKQHALVCHQEEDMKRIFDYYNSL